MKVVLTLVCLLWASLASAQHLGFVVGPTEPPNAEAGDFWSDTATDTLKRFTGTVWEEFGGGAAAAWGAITGTLATQTDLQTALDAKQVAGSYATAAQGATADSALQPGGNGGSLTGLTKTQVGLSNVDNTTDAGKPVSSATQTALNDKQSTLVSGTNIKTVNGSTLLGSGDLVVGGAAAWGSITGTLSSQSDLQTALDGKQVSGSYATGTGSANGTNTGDQISIVGITGTAIEFNQAVTDANFVYGGGTATGTNTGDQTTVSGNAGTATTLQTPRTINGVSFNGSANITVPAAGSTLSDTVTVAKGGTGLTALGSSLQVLRTNAAATALEYATIAAGGGPVTLRVASDQVSSSTSFANVTGLTTAVSASTTYSFRCNLLWSSSATTEGGNVSVNGPASTAIRLWRVVYTSATAHTSATVTAFDGGVLLTAGPGSAFWPVELYGTFTVSGAGGTFAIRWRAETGVANTMTIRAGSFCQVY